MNKVKRIVDNQAFLLGLDNIYRKKMKEHEQGELLALAHQIVMELNIPIKDVPIEGYYYENEKLTEYFKIMKTLQNTLRFNENRIISKQMYLRLKEVAESPLFGKPGNGNYLISQSEDILTQALKETDINNWKLTSLVEKASVLAGKSEDYSIVTLAALANDPLLLTALRETAVLYEVAMAGCAAIIENEYVWQVDEEIENRANKFIHCFNKLFNENIPDANCNNAKTYWNAYDKWEKIGRCVRIGYDDSKEPVQHYHWAIEYNGYDLAVNEFWDSHIWTTQMYREKMGIL